MIRERNSTCMHCSSICKQSCYKIGRVTGECNADNTDCKCSDEKVGKQSQQNMKSWLLLTIDTHPFRSLPFNMTFALMHKAASLTASNRSKMPLVCALAPQTGTAIARTAMAARRKVSIP